MLMLYLGGLPFTKRRRYDHHGCVGWRELSRFRHWSFRIVIQMTADVDCQQMRVYNLVAQWSLRRVVQ